MALEIWSMDFVSLVVVAFSIVMLLAGILAAVFGSGKAKGYGGVMAVVGVALLGIWIWLCGFSDIQLFADVPLWDVFIDGIINLIGILIGALIAVGIFLVVVLKS
ncbi:MAG: hypothetical protein J5813_02460 [Candidatus Methanomethylophilaceae archaeon]|nr:hypothetical protein [Candidatus Methanomethylophilaceae archaeon]